METRLTPTKTLPSIRIPMVGAIPITTAPEMKSRSAMMIVSLRPKVSEKGPPIKEPKAAASTASDTIDYSKLLLRYSKHASYYFIL